MPAPDYKEKSAFEKILVKGMRSGQVPTANKSREWFRSAAKAVSSVSDNRLFDQEKGRLVSAINPGHLYLFRYDPKWKDVLPYYDTLPLVFPIQPAKGGFLGLNVHYIQPMLRARLMDGLYQYTNNQKYDESTYLNISYELLKGVSNLKYYKPCVKHYLTGHVTSKFMLIPPVMWDVALFLPLARFQKKYVQSVYAESKNMVG